MATRPPFSYPADPNDPLREELRRGITLPGDTFRRALAPQARPAPALPADGDERPAWRRVLDTIQAPLNTTGAGFGAVVGGIAGLFGSDAYERAVARRADEYGIGPDADLIDSLAIAPGPGTVLAEALAPGRPETAAGRIAKNVGSMAGDIVGDPANWIAGGLAGARALGSFARTGVRDVGRMAPALGDLSRGTDEVVDAVRAARSITRTEAGKQALGQFLGSATAGLVYAPDIAIGTVDSLRAAKDAYDRGDFDTAAEMAVQAGFMGGIGGLTLHGVRTEANALRRPPRVPQPMVDTIDLVDRLVAEQSGRPRGTVFQGEIPEPPFVAPSEDFTLPPPDVWDGTTPPPGGPGGGAPDVWRGRPPVMPWVPDVWDGPGPDEGGPALPTVWPGPTQGGPAPGGATLAPEQALAERAFLRPDMDAATAAETARRAREWRRAQSLEAQIEDLADRIARGERPESPEDIQLAQNEPEALEAALRVRQERAFLRPDPEAQANAETARLAREHLRDRAEAERPISVGRVEELDAPIGPTRIFGADAERPGKLQDPVLEAMLQERWENQRFPLQQLQARADARFEKDSKGLDNEQLQRLAGDTGVASDPLGRLLIENAHGLRVMRDHERRPDGGMRSWKEGSPFEDVPEGPTEIIRAVAEDRDNPLYLKAREAAARWMDDKEIGDAADFEAADADTSFDPDALEAQAGAPTLLTRPESGIDSLQPYQPPKTPLDELIAQRLAANAARAEAERGGFGPGRVPALSDEGTVDLADVRGRMEALRQRREAERRADMDAEMRMLDEGGMQPVTPQQPAIPDAARPAAPTPSDRRAEPDLRARVDQFIEDNPNASREELRAEVERLRAELDTDALTGLGSARAMERSEQTAGGIAAFDLAGLKWFNDTLGHDAGDEALRAVGQAFREAGATGFRKSGDEFFLHAQTPEAAAEAAKRVQDVLAGVMLKWTGPDGAVKTFSGLRIDYGVGGSRGEADSALYAGREAAVARGERAPRGERPAGLREVGGPEPEGVAVRAPEGGQAGDRVPAEAVAPTLERLKRPDGRLAPLEGDEVYQTVRGFGGTPAGIRGKVERRRDGSLGVRVTGSAAVIGGTSQTGKLLPMGPEWTVVGDPEIKRRREAAEAAEREREAARKAEEEAYQAEVSAREQAAVDAGEQRITAENAIPGLRVTDHYSGQQGFITQVGKDGTVYWSEPGEALEGRSGGRLTTDGTLATDMVQAEFRRIQEAIKEESGEPDEKWEREMRARYGAALGPEPAPEPRPTPAPHDTRTPEAREGEVTITFPKKPAVAVRKGLKAAGFKWDNDRGAWVAPKPVADANTATVRAAAARGGVVRGMDEAPAATPAAEKPTVPWVATEVPAATVEIRGTNGMTIRRAAGGVSWLPYDASGKQIGVGGTQEAARRQALEYHQAQLTAAVDEEPTATPAPPVAETVAPTPAATDIQTGAADGAPRPEPVDEPAADNPAALEGAPAEDVPRPAAGGDAGPGDREGVPPDGGLTARPGGEGNGLLGGMGSRPGGVGAAPDRGGRPGTGDAAGPVAGAGDGRRGAGNAPAVVPSHGGTDVRLSTLEDKRSATQVAKDNLAAIRLLKDIESTARAVTPEDQAALVKYGGWGRLPQLFDSYNRDFAGLRAEFESLLTPEELDAARRSTLNAHYTSEPVIRSMWDAVRRLGFKPGMVWQEPSMGIGHFFGLQPDDLMPGRRVGVELDPLTARMAKLLYPESAIYNRGYEAVSLPNDYFDLTLGNIPFGDFPVSDSAYKKWPFLTRRIHDYFIAKTLDRTRPGGVVALITSKGTLDKQDAVVRKWVADRADLLGAIRLPRTAFKGNAGTEVVTDILFFRKRAPGEARSGESFIDSVPLEVNGRTFHVNEYFHRNPDMVVGRHSDAGSLYGAREYTVEGDLTPEALAERVARLPENSLVEWKAPEESFRPDIAEATEGPQIKQGGFGIRDGVLVIRDGNTLRPAALKPDAAERVRGLLGVRDAVRAALKAQQGTGDDAAIDAGIKALNKSYDAFVKKHGPINSRKNTAAFEGDPDLPLLLALEDWNPDTKTASKAAIFSQRVIQPYRPPTHADSVSEALTISLNESGRPDWARIQELTGKTPEEARRELGDMVFEDPESRRWVTRDEYLSGPVRTKLRIAQEIAKANPAYQRNVKALEAVQPVDLKPEQIRGRLGQMWFDDSDVQAFLAHLLEIPQSRIRVSRAANIGSWSVVAPYTGFSKWSTEKVDVVELVEHALHNRRPTVYHPPDADGRRAINHEATIAANDKLESIQEEFGRWLWDDPARAARLLKTYNDEFNNDVQRSFDGGHLTMPGMARSILRGGDLAPHQKNVIWRGLQGAMKNNLLIAHEVGAGKTFEMVGMAMEMRRIGLARKPMFVVPDHLVAQWGSEFLRLYPNANVLVADKAFFGTRKGRGGLSAEKRKLASSRIATGNYDAVIVSKGSFKRLPVSNEAYESFVRVQVDDLKIALDALKLSEGKKGSRIVKEVERAIAKWESRLKKYLDTPKDDVVTFDELGVDALFVDEAHAYKKLEVPTRMTRVLGIAKDGSQQAQDMFMKVREVQRRNGGGGVVFATATPVTNTMGEVFVMQRFLQQKLLERLGLQHFDSWASQFGQVVTGVEWAPEGGFRQASRFSKFVNVPDLAAGFRNVADVLSQEDLKLPRPGHRGGKATLKMAPASPELRAVFAEIADEAVAARKSGKDAGRKLLEMMNKARQVATDMRLYYPDAPDDPNSKVNTAVQTIAKEHKDSASTRGTQIVFLDLGVPKGGERAPDADTDGAAPAAEVITGEEKLKGDKLYGDIRRKLVKAGVPEKEIAFIHDADTDAKKQALFTAMNEGRVRVLLGSTGKMGTGMNAQKRVVAIHHLDVPWFPADLVQRNGRAFRQGNIHKEVAEYRYATEGSFDAFMWGSIERKVGFIDSFMKVDPALREMEDIGMMQLEASEMKAIATGDPRVMEKVGLDAEIAKLGALQAAHAQRQRQIKYNLAASEDNLGALARRLERVQADAKHVASIKGDEFTASIGKSKFKERPEAAKALQAAIEAVPEGSVEKIEASINGFGVVVDKKSKSSSALISVEGPSKHEYPATFNRDSPTGTLQSVEAVIRSIPRVPDMVQADIERVEKGIAKMRKEVGAEFEHAARLDRAKKRSAQIEAEIGLEREKNAEEAHGTDTDAEDAVEADVTREMARRAAPGQRGMFAEDVPLPEPKQPAPKQGALFGGREMLVPSVTRTTEGREADGPLFRQEQDARDRAEERSQASLLDEPREMARVSGFGPRLDAELTRITDEAERLADEIDAGYEAGRDVADLEQQYEALQERLENIAAEFEHDDELVPPGADFGRGETEGGNQVGDRASVEEQLGNLYFESVVRPDLARIAPEYVMENARAVLRDAQMGGMSPRGLRDVSDDEIRVAMKDAYERRRSLHERLRQRVAGVRQKLRAMIREDRGPGSADRVHEGDKRGARAGQFIVASPDPETRAAAKKVAATLGRNFLPALDRAFRGLAKAAGVDRAKLLGLTLDRRVTANVTGNAVRLNLFAARADSSVERGLYHAAVHELAHIVTEQRAKADPAFAARLDDGGHGDGYAEVLAELQAKLRPERRGWLRTIGAALSAEDGRARKMIDETWQADVAPAWRLIRAREAERGGPRGLGRPRGDGDGAGEGGPRPRARDAAGGAAGGVRSGEPVRGGRVEAASGVRSGAAVQRGGAGAERPADVAATRDRRRQRADAPEGPEAEAERVVGRMRRNRRATGARWIAELRRRGVDHDPLFRWLDQRGTVRVTRDEILAYLDPVDRPRTKPGHPSGEPPMVEERVESMREAERAVDEPPAELDRQTRANWSTLDASIRSMLRTMNDADFYGIMESRRLNDAEVQAWAARVAGKKERAEAASVALAAARAEGGDTLEAERAHLEATMDYIRAERAMVNDGTGAARALAARRRLMQASRLDNDEFLRSLFRDLPNASDAQVADIVRAWRTDPQAVPDLLRAAIGYDTLDKALEVWKAGLLSAPSTDIANLTGNAGEAGARIAEGVVAAGVDRLLSMFGGTTRARRLEEAGAEVAGLIDVFPGAASKLLADLKGVVKDGDRWFPDKQIGASGRWERDVGAVGGVGGRLARTSFRKLDVEDQFFKALTGAGVLRKLAMRRARQALGEAASAEAVRARAAEIVEEALSPTSPRHADLLQEVEKEKLSRTFQDDPGRLGSDLIRLARDNRLVAVIFPFIKTPANILKVTLQRSPLGYGEAKRRYDVWRKAIAEGAGAAEVRRLQGEAADAIARPLLGTTLLAGFAALAQAGVMTGGGPTDSNEERLLRDSGWQPYSFVFRDGEGRRYYVPYNRFEPVSTIFGYAADLIEIKDEKKAGDMLDKAVGSLAANLVNKTYLQGLSDAANLIAKPSQFASRYLSNLTGSLVPNIVARAARGIDPTLRDTTPEKTGLAGIPERATKTVLSRIPGLTGLVPERASALGDPVRRQGSTFSRFGLPVQMSVEEPGSLERELLAADYAPQAPGRDVTINRQRVRLTDEEYDILLRYRRAAAARVGEIVKMGSFQRRPEDDRRRVAQGVFRDYGDRAREQAKARARARLARERSVRPAQPSAGA